MSPVHYQCTGGNVAEHGRQQHSFVWLILLFSPDSSLFFVPQYNIFYLTAIYQVQSCWYRHLKHWVLELIARSSCFM